jgi:hypothetical protein
MRFAGAFVPALSDDPLAMGNDATYAGIGLGGVETLLGQAQCLRHVHSIDGGKSHGSK